MKLHLRIRGVTCHTGSQCYQPPDTGEHTPPYPSQTDLIYLPGGMEGWVDLGDWLHTEMVYPHTEWRSPIHVLTRQSTSGSRTRDLLIISPTPLATTPPSHHTEFMQRSNQLSAITVHVACASVRIAISRQPSSTDCRPHQLILLVISIWGRAAPAAEHSDVTRDGFDR